MNRSVDRTMLSERTNERLAGALLVASFVAFAAHGVTLATLGAGIVTIAFVLVYGLLIALAGLVLLVVFRERDQTIALLSAFGFVAHGLFIVLTCVLLLGGQRFPDEFAATYGEASDAPRRIVTAIELTMDKMRTGAFVFLGEGAAALGAMIVASRATARWIAWLGVVAGSALFVAALLAFLGVKLGGSVPMVMMPALAGALAFLLALGVRLLTRACDDSRATR